MLAKAFGEDPSKFHSAAIAVLEGSNSNVTLHDKLKLTQCHLATLGDDDVSVDVLVRTILNVLNKIENLEKFLEGFNFSTDNETFLRLLIEELGTGRRKAATYLLQHLHYKTDSLHIDNQLLIPISLLPKLLPKLTKPQVMRSLTACTDPSPHFSRCLLSLVQSSYPLHLLNLLLHKTLVYLSSASYSAEEVANVVRACALIAKQKEAARHHAPYLLTSVLEVMCKGSSSLVRDLTPALYPLFDSCLVQGLQFLQARLSPGAKQLFSQIHGHYKQNVKYQGKT